MNIKINLLVSLLFVYVSCYAQEPSAEKIIEESKAFFLNKSKAGGLNYKKPEGYTEIFNWYQSAALGKSLLSSPDLQLIDVDSTTLIYVAILTLDTNNATIKNARKWGLLQNLNTSYLSRVGNSSDTVQTPVRHFTKEDARKKFNADAAGISDVTIWKRNEYKGRYDKCKALFLHKENKCDVFIYYFYMNKRQEPIEREIRKTSQFIIFKE